MRIADLTLFVVELPLKREVRHASAIRTRTENLIARCRLTDGTVGWGEGVPRAYVTGETAAGAIEQWRKTPIAAQLSGYASDWPTAIQICRQFAPVCDRADPRGIGSNALCAAVEISLLDAFGRHFGEPLSAVVSHLSSVKALVASQSQVRYSAAIMAEGTWSELTSALKMKLYGFANCKVKVGMAGADDGARLRRIRRMIGRGVDLRVDANESWPLAEVFERTRQLSACKISCIEQPVRNAEVRGLAELRRELNVPIMLDESLCGMADARDAVEHGTCDLFNLRLSKCGGFLNCLDLAAFAQRHGLGYQLGCHPGESGILSAAGRHFATAVAGLRYLEGSYDRHLLSQRLTVEDITFGYGGWAPALRGPGLGVAVDEASVRRLATEHVAVTLA